MTTMTKYMRTAEVQKLLGFGTPDGTIAYLRRSGLAPVRVGRRLLWPEVSVGFLLSALNPDTRDGYDG